MVGGAVKKWRLQLILQIPVIFKSMLPLSNVNIMIFTKGNKYVIGIYIYWLCSLFPYSIMHDTCFVKPRRHTT